MVLHEVALDSVIQNHLGDRSSLASFDRPVVLELVDGAGDILLSEVSIYSLIRSAKLRC
jgi:hypothetical protein